MAGTAPSPGSISSDSNVYTDPNLKTTPIPLPIAAWWPTPPTVVQFTSLYVWTKSGATTPTSQPVVMRATVGGKTLIPVSSTSPPSTSTAPPSPETPKLTGPTTSSTQTSLPFSSSSSSQVSSSTSTPGWTEGQSQSPTSSSTAAPQHSAGVGRLSNGAVAGVAIGCLIAGLIIGAFAALCLFRRGQKPRPGPEYLRMQYSPGEKPLPLGPVPDKLQLDQFLLESKPDADIAAELRSLGQLIQQHVEDQYHLRPIQHSPDALAPILVDLGLLDERDQSAAVNLASLAIEPRTRWAALQHVISRVTFESISLDGHSPVSLLPPFAGALVQSLPPVESHRGSSEAVKVALTRWRQLTAFLLHPSRSERTPLMPSEDVSTQQAQQLAAALSRFLQAFVSGDRESRYEQENHLREVIVECAALGYVLFSQPSEFRFRYDKDEDGGSSNGIVTCPGLDKVSDEEGRNYAKPYTLVAPVIEGTYVGHTGF